MCVHLLLLEGGSFVWLIIVPLVLIVELLLHHIGDSLSLASFSTHILSTSFLFNIKRCDQTFNSNLLSLML